MANVLNKCPICGGKLKFSGLYQYARVFTIKRNGELSVNSRKEDVGSMECGFISCIEAECDFVTNCDLECEEHKNISIWMENDKYYYEDSNVD